MPNNIQLGTCPCSWGVWYPNDQFQPNWQQFLNEARDVGHKVIELGPFGYLPTELSRLKDELAMRDMSVCSTAHMSDLINPNALDIIRSDIEKICPILNGLGAEYFVFMDGDELYEHPYDRNLNLNQWKYVTGVINEIAKIVHEEYGLIFSFHPHVSTCVENEHQIIRLLNDTDEKRVNLCFDTGHHLYSGGVPQEFIHQFASRINYYHLKDMSLDILSKVKREGLSDNNAFEMGVMVPLGQGNVDFDSIKEAMITTDYTGYAIIEQDLYPDKEGIAKLYATNNLNYALSKGLGHE